MARKSVQNEFPAGMKFITDTDCVTWCDERSYPTRETTDHRTRGASQRPDGFQFVPIKIPADSGRKVWLAGVLHDLVAPAPETLLWIPVWSVFPSSEHIPLFARLRGALGESRPLIEIPGHLLSAGDRDDAISLIVVALQFFWDLHLVSSTGRDAVYVSHHEDGWFGSQDPETCRKATVELRSVLDADAIST